MLSFLCTQICPSLSSMHIRVFGHLSIYLSMFLDVSLRFVPSASLCVLLPAYFLLCAYVWLFQYITSLPLDFVFFVRLLYTLSEWCFVTDDLSLLCLRNFSQTTSGRPCRKFTRQTWFLQFQPIMNCVPCSNKSSSTWTLLLVGPYSLPPQQTGNNRPTGKRWIWSIRPIGGTAVFPSLVNMLVLFPGNNISLSLLYFWGTNPIYYGNQNTTTIRLLLLFLPLLQLLLLLLPQRLYNTTELWYRPSYTLTCKFRSALTLSTYPMPYRAQEIPL